MKVANTFLSKIIQEEIKNILYEDHIERNLIQLFVKYRNFLTKNPTDNKEVITNLQKDIKRIAPNKNSEQILASLEGKIDRQLFSFVSNLLKRDKRMAAFSDKLDNYEMSITPDEQNVYQVYNKQDPDPGFMRVPKDDEAYDQEDVRKDIKTLAKENNKMKLTKEYLKQLIKESIEEAAEDPGSKYSEDEIARRREAAFAGMEDPPTPGKSFASTIPPEAAPAAQGLEKRKPLKPNVQKLSAIYSDAWTQLNKVKSDLDILVKNMREAGQMLKVQLEEDKEENEE